MMIRTLISLTMCGALSISAQVFAEATPTYNRSEWKHWIDVDKDCENTREEMLARDALIILHTTSNCSPKYGVWSDPYTGTWFFNSSSLDADHIVPLKHAHTMGGYLWSAAQKRQFANDPDNILIVSASSNRSKGAKAPHNWMPPKETYGCKYISQWDYVKQKYNLQSSATERKFKKEYTETNC